MANINRQWQRIVAISCTHGNALDRKIAEQVLAFCERYKPQRKVHLGDVTDTTAFRSGARGTPDEGVDVSTDQDAGIEFLRKLRGDGGTVRDWAPARAIYLARQNVGVE